MLPIECKIPYSAAAGKTLMRLCQQTFRQVGGPRGRNPNRGVWGLGEPGEFVAAAIRVSQWIEETYTVAEQAIVGPPEELAAALDRLMDFINERFYELGVKQAPSGVYSVADEHVAELDYLLQAYAACAELRGEVNAQIARWTIDSEQRDELHPLVVKALRFFTNRLLTAVERSSWERARDYSQNCARLIDALDRLGWDAADPEPNTFGVPPEEVLGQLVAAYDSPVAKELLITIGSGDEEG